MAFQETVNEVKDRLQNTNEQVQAAAKAAVEANKKAYSVLSEGVQELAKNQQTAAKELFEEARNSFNKAREAGVRAVADEPSDFLPSSDRAVKAFEDGKTLVINTRAELIEVVKKGVNQVKAELQGKPVKQAAKKVVKKATATAKKATATAKKTAKKVVD